MPWFWRGELQRGGVLNDMLCHSALVVRHLLTRPGDALSTVRPVRITGHIASLKWTRPKYAKQLRAKTMGRDVDYTKRPSEDFASLHHRVRDGRRPDGIRRSVHLVELRRRRLATLGRAARPGVLDVMEHARCGTEVVLLARRAGPCRRRSRREAERRNRADAGGRQRSRRVRVRGGRSPLRPRVSREGGPAIDVRRRARSCENAHDGVSERRAGAGRSTFHRAAWTSSYRPPVARGDVDADQDEAWRHEEET